MTHYRINGIRKAGIVLILLLFVSTNFSSAQNIFYNNNNQNRKYEPSTTDQKLIQTLNLIRTFYVDTVNEPKLVEAAIQEMLKTLDPHSVYISKHEVQEANEQLVGNFDGIGVQFNILNDTIEVVNVIPGGPSEKLGIMSGDKIVKIDDVDAFGKKITNTYVTKHLRGEKGTKVKVSISRRGKKGLIDYTITRDKIPITSIDATYMVTPETGYIKLLRFSKPSIDEFHKSMKELKSQGMKNLILDLRDNPGGYLDEADSLADQFLKANKLIVYTEGNNSPRQNYNSTSKGDFENGKLAILINENSASASEIVSGAVQDWDRGIIIGRRSFGKGLVQKPFMLSDGSQIRLTTARYCTPTGRCIQRSYKGGTEKYYKDFQARFKHKEHITADSIKLPDSLKYYTPNKRVVFGGGGIMPDIFIPLDTSYYSDYFSNVLRKGVLYQFTIQYIDDNRAEIKSKYPTFKQFADKFNIDESFLTKFTNYCEKQGVKKDEKGFNISKEYIALNLKALIARNLWTVDAFYQIVDTKDVTLKKAIELLQGNELKKMKIQDN